MGRRSTRRHPQRGVSTQNIERRAQCNPAPSSPCVVESECLNNTLAFSRALDLKVLDDTQRKIRKGVLLADRPTRGEPDNARSESVGKRRQRRNRCQSTNKKRQDNETPEKKLLMFIDPLDKHGTASTPSKADKLLRPLAMLCPGCQQCTAAFSRTKQNVEAKLAQQWLSAEQAKTQMQERLKSYHEAKERLSSLQLQAQDKAAKIRDLVAKTEARMRVEMAELDVEEEEASAHNSQRATQTTESMLPSLDRSWRKEQRRREHIEEQRKLLIQRQLELERLQHTGHFNKLSFTGGDTTEPDSMHVDVEQAKIALLEQHARVCSLRRAWNECSQAECGLLESRKGERFRTLRNLVQAECGTSEELHYSACTLTLPVGHPLAVAAKEAQEQRHTYTSTIDRKLCLVSRR